MERSRWVRVGLVGTTWIFPGRPERWYSRAASSRSVTSRTPSRRLLERSSGRGLYTSTSSPDHRPTNRRSNDGFWVTGGGSWEDLPSTLSAAHETAGEAIYPQQLTTVTHDPCSEAQRDGCSHGPISVVRCSRRGFTGRCHQVDPFEDDRPARRVPRASQTLPYG